MTETTRNAPKCKHCSNECQLWGFEEDSYYWDHCHDCHYKFVGKGYYIDEVINGTPEDIGKRSANG
jgi:hypothetical protein